MSKKMKKRILVVGTSAFAFLMSCVMVIASFFDNGKSSAHVGAISSNVGNQTTLSMVEMNDSFDKMVLKATENKTLIYVDKLYFDYSPMSTNRLRETVNEETDYVVIDIENSSGEWAKTWGYVRHEKGIRPNDPMMREMELTYLEINQYWEWRNFTNQENWSIKVKDGYSTISMNFDMNSGADGAVYHIDGVYALPEHYYNQVIYWWDFNGDNPELLEIREQYRQQAIEKAETTPDGEPIKFDEIEYRQSDNTNNRTSTTSRNGVVSRTGMTGTGNTQPERVLFWIPVLIVAVVVVSSVAVYKTYEAKQYKDAYTDLASQPQNRPSDITDPYDPNQRNENTAPAPTPEQTDEYNNNRPELTDEEKEELEKHKEFTIDNDVPTGQKIVKLKVKNADGILQDVLDENGTAVYVNRKTYTVGNQTYALINRETNLLIRWFPSTMELKDIVGNVFTVNVDNKIMNMDGVEPYSPISRNDILNKLSSTGKYTSAIDPDRMLYRMDDDKALIKAMALKNININKGFWGTISSAFKNLFGGGNGSKGFLSNFLDVLIIIGVVLVAFFLVFLLYKFLSVVVFKKGSSK